MLRDEYDPPLVIVDMHAEAAPVAEYHAKQKSEQALLLFRRKRDQLAAAIGDLVLIAGLEAEPLGELENLADLKGIRIT